MHKNNRKPIAVAPGCIGNLEREVLAFNSADSILCTSLLEIVRSFSSVARNHDHISRLSSLFRTDKD